MIAIIAIFAALDHRYQTQFYSTSGTNYSDGVRHPTGFTL